MRCSISSRTLSLAVAALTRGQTVSDEAAIQKNGRKSDVAVNARGKPVKS
jgi:hypothetical protein